VLKENEIIWREELQQHEELCLICRQAVSGLDVESLEIMDKMDEDSY
jgi:hypothetical protein